MRKLVLASGSPRRCALLDQIGVDYTVCPADVIETKSFGNPKKAVVENAFRKADAASKMLTDALVIGADTAVVLNGSMLGKPKSNEDAAEMLEALSGNMHLVLTGLALFDPGTGELWTECEETKVYFRVLDKAEIDSYIKSGFPMDKAGAYGIQDKGALFVERIEGCYYNVVGLPLVAVVGGLKYFGISVW
jgi:septum formation protein